MRLFLVLCVFRHQSCAGKDLTLAMSCRRRTESCSSRLVSRPQHFRYTLVFDGSFPSKLRPFVTFVSNFHQSMHCLLFHSIVIDYSPGGSSMTLYLRTLFIASFCVDQDRLYSVKFLSFILAYSQSRSHHLDVTSLYCDTMYAARVSFRP